MALKIVLITLFALGALSTIGSIGDERKPITRRTAAIVTLIDVILIIWIINSL